MATHSFVKQSPGKRAARFLGSFLFSLLSLGLTAVLLLELLLVGGGKSAAKPSGNLGLTDQFTMSVNNRISSALDGVAVVKKTYMISEDAVTAQVPNPDCYGHTDDPSTLGWLLEQAEPLLDGQKLYFSTDMEIIPGSEVTYYLDDTILSITWKQPIHYAAYTFTETKILHPSQFRRFLSGGSFGSGQLSLTSEMAKTVNAVAAGSGDFYGYRPQGTVVYNGEAKRANPGGLDVCFVNRQGDLILESSKPFVDLDTLQQYVDEHDISFSLSFGPMLVKDGEKAPYSGYYPIGEGNENYSRAAICQMDKLHYLMVTANFENGYYVPPTLTQLRDTLYDTGCQQAFTLDGGQTATMVVNNQVVNNVNYGAERLISDIYYFATAKPLEG